MLISAAGADVTVSIADRETLSTGQPDRFQQLFAVELDGVLARHICRPKPLAPELVAGEVAVLEQDRADHRAGRPQFREGLRHKVLDGILLRFSSMLRSPDAWIRNQSALATGLNRGKAGQPYPLAIFSILAHGRNPIGRSADSPADGCQAQQLRGGCQSAPVVPQMLAALQSSKSSKSAAIGLNSRKSERRVQPFFTEPACDVDFTYRSSVCADDVSALFV